MIASAVLGEYLSDVQRFYAVTESPYRLRQGLRDALAASVEGGFASSLAEWFGSEIAETYLGDMLSRAKAQRHAEASARYTRERQAKAKPRTKRQRSDSATLDLLTLLLVRELETEQERQAVRLSGNYLAIRLDCSSSTAWRILRRLEKASLLLRAMPGEGGQATRWSLTTTGREKSESRLTKEQGEQTRSEFAPGLTLGQATALSPGILPGQEPIPTFSRSGPPKADNSESPYQSTSGLSQLSSHVLDGFKSGGRYGRTDALVWSLLSDEPQSADAIRAQADMSRSVVFDSLNVLASKGLASKAKGGWIRGPKRPEQVAWEMGTLGMTERQRKRRVANSARNRNYRERAA